MLSAFVLYLNFDYAVYGIDEKFAVDRNSVCVDYVVAVVVVENGGADVVNMLEGM